MAEGRNGAPAVVASVSLPVDGPAGVGVWRSGRHGELIEDRGLPEVSGDVRSVAVDQNDGTAVLVGSAWTGTALTPFLWTSASSGWTSMDLGADAPTGGLHAVAVEGGRAWALSNGPLDRHDLLTVDLATGTWSSTPLPDPGDGRRRTLLDLRVRDGRVVVVAHEGPAGAAGSPVSYVSADGGTTVDGFHSIGDGRFGTRVSGLVETPQGFVATGATGESHSEAEPVLWRSVDGATWVEEPLTVQEVVFPNGAPDVSVAHPVSEDDGTLSVTLTARDGGSWARGTRLDGEWWSGMNQESFAADGVLIRDEIQEYSFIGWGDTNLGSWGYGLYADYSERVAVPGSRIHWLELPDPSAAGGLLAQQSVWETEGDTSWSDTVATDLVREGDGFVLQSWRPAEADGWGGLELASAGPTKVAVGYSRAGLRWHVEVAVSDDSGETWAAADGIESDTDLLTYLVTQVDGTFYLAATEGRRQMGNDEMFPVVWTSQDGRSWSRLAETLAIDKKFGAVRDVCALPSGGVVLVGYTNDAQDRRIAATWVEQDGEWIGHAHGDLGDGAFTSCATREDAVVVSGDASGFNRTWHTTDGVSVTEVGALAEGVSRGEPLPIGSERRPAGWVAPGFLDTAEHVGPVLWFSTDAESWEWLPLPGPTLTGRVSIAKDGQDLVVISEGRVSPRAWVVPDVASVF